MFGVPVVLNPTLAIPFITIPLVLQAISYFLFKFHILHMIIASVPWTTPTLLNGFLITSGDWKAVVWQAICVLIAVAGYWPFFKVLDKKAWAVEQGEAAPEE